MRWRLARTGPQGSPGSARSQPVSPTIESSVAPTIDGGALRRVPIATAAPDRRHSGRSGSSWRVSFETGSRRCSSTPGAVTRRPWPLPGREQKRLRSNSGQRRLLRIREGSCNGGRALVERSPRRVAALAAAERGRFRLLGGLRELREQVDYVPVGILDLCVALAPERVRRFLGSSSAGVSELSVETVDLFRRVTLKGERDPMPLGGW